MPYDRPGKMFYATATKAVVHNAPCVELGIPGVAVKQIPAPFGTGPAFVSGALNPALVTVAIGEAFAIKVKGIIEVPITGITSPTKGDAVYIVTADNTLTKTVGSNVKLGRIVELAGSRGTRTGFCRIDLDLKATF